MPHHTRLQDDATCELVPAHFTFAGLDVEVAAEGLV